MKRQLEKQHISYRVHTTGTSLTVLCAWFDMWQVYSEDGSRKHHLPPMNEYPNFFRYTGEAHLRALILSAYSLYDPGPGRVTLPALLKEIQMDRERAKRAGNFIAAGGRIAARLKPLRHYLIAHRSDKHTFQDAYAEAGLTPNLLSRLVTMSCAAYNCIAQAAGQPKFYRVRFARNEMIAMLNELRGEK